MNKAQLIEAVAKTTKLTTVNIGMYSAQKLIFVIFNFSSRCSFDCELLAHGRIQKFVKIFSKRVLLKN